MTTQRDVAWMTSPHSPCGESWGSPRACPTICSKTNSRSWASVAIPGTRAQETHNTRNRGQSLRDFHITSPPAECEEPSGDWGVDEPTPDAGAVAAHPRYPGSLM